LPDQFIRNKLDVILVDQYGEGKGIRVRNRFQIKMVKIETGIPSWLSVLAIGMLFLFSVFPTAVQAAEGDDSDSANGPPKLAAVRYVTWWSHDALGYHPAIYLRLENISGANLVGERLRIQVRFTNVRTTDVTVARSDQRISLLKNQQKDIMLRGPIPFELSIDQNAWPAIECKAMSRIGDVGDSGTTTLAITNLDRVTMTDDEAQTQLEKQPDLRRVSYGGSPPRTPDSGRRFTTDEPEKPMVATAGGLNSPPKLTPKAGHFVMPAGLPQLGDNFYVFEKHFGLPTEIEAPSKGKTDITGSLTWASYKPTNTFSNIFVASRNGANADVIVVTFPAASELKEDQTLAVARELSGKAKSPLGGFSHTVRYLSSGRSEFMEASTPTCKALAFAVSQGPGAKLALVVSRIPGDPENFILLSAQRIRMLQVLLAR
jgi:hypothetical protein